MYPYQMIKVHHNTNQDIAKEQDMKEEIRLYETTHIHSNYISST